MRQAGVECSAKEHLFRRPFLRRPDAFWQNRRGGDLRVPPCASPQRAPSLLHQRQISRDISCAPTRRASCARARRAAPESQSPLQSASHLPLERARVENSHAGVLDPRGTKRTCTSCLKRFYDLSRTPIRCPECLVVLPPVASRGARSRPGAQTPGGFGSWRRGIATDATPVALDNCDADPRAASVKSSQHADGERDDTGSDDDTGSIDETESGDDGTADDTTLLATLDDDEISPARTMR